MKALETERLIIRPFLADDLEAAHKLLDHDLAWSGQGFSIAQRQERLEFYRALANWDDTGNLYGYRAIILKGANELIGTCGFTPRLWSADERAAFDLLADNSPYTTLEVEIGYAVGSRFRRQGYASEAVKAVVTYALGSPRLERVLAVTGRENGASINVMKRIGMKTAMNHHLDVWPGVVGVASPVIWIEENHEDNHP